MVLLPADRSGLDPLSLGREIGRALFPGAPKQVTLDDQGGSRFPVVRIRVARAYARGGRPRVRLEAAQVVGALTRAGLTSVSLDVEAPSVPATATWSVAPDDQQGGSWYWRSLRAGGPAPSGEVVLAPRPIRAWSTLALLVLVLTALALGARRAARRQRLVTALCGVIALGTSALMAWTAAATQGDNLGVAGVLSGLPLRVASLLPLLALPGLVLGAALVAVAVARGGGAPPDKS